MMSRALLASALVALCLLPSGCGRRAHRVMIQNKGSDTLVNVAQIWAEEYRRVAPSVAVAVSGGGSGTGIAALINDTVDIANASREVHESEREAAHKNSGKMPVEHVVAYDALAVYVHPSNPVTSLSRAKLACIFAAEPRCRRWSDVGVEVPGCASDRVIRVSRQNNSGTFAYFQEWLYGGTRDLALGSMDMQGSKDLVDLIERTPCAIGYSGLGYKTPRVRTICLSSEEGAPCVEATSETAADRSYPLSRALYMYTLGEPTGAVADYIRWIRSDAGQEVVQAVGFAPLPADQREGG